mgnify:CR=1 FL=1
MKKYERPNQQKKYRSEKSLSGKKRVAAYCRVSTEKEEQAQSFESQCDFFRCYIEQKKEWEFYKVFADEGISGTSTKKREQFNRMIAEAKQRKFDLLITKGISRFARNTLDSIYYTRELRKVGVGVLFLNDGINTLDGDAELRLSIMASIAQEESRKTSERVKWGQKRRMEEGVVFGRSMLVLQQKAISGKVVDSKGESIIGANIMEKGTSNGTITDFDGNFSLNVSAKSVLQISYIGYKTQEIPVSQLKAGAVITLKEDTEVMDEVVVIGYGTQRKGDVTSAIASVKAEDFTVGKVGDAADLIKGKVAGLSIAKGSGDPNATSAIRLRGVISVNGSTTPLILIDGVEGDLSTVAPENIEAIDVLKDASAAAIYGTRGANGVILITTKTGKREAHTTASYSGYVSASQFGKKLDFMCSCFPIY